MKNIIDCKFHWKVINSSNNKNTNYINRNRNLLQRWGWEDRSSAWVPRSLQRDCCFELPQYTPLRTTPQTNLQTVYWVNSVVESRKIKCCLKRIPARFSPLKRLFFDWSPAAQLAFSPEALSCFKMSQISDLLYFWYLWDLFYCLQVFKSFIK